MEAREYHRINKENGIIAKFSRVKIEDRMIKKAIIKAGKKMNKAFSSLLGPKSEMNDD